jgi:hypothetical protein
MTPQLTHGTFVRLRELENEYHERVTEAVLYVFDKAIKTDFEEFDEEARDVMPMYNVVYMCEGVLTSTGTDPERQGHAGQYVEQLS